MRVRPPTAKPVRRLLVIRIVAQFSCSRNSLDSRTKTSISWAGGQIRNARETAVERAYNTRRVDVCAKAFPLCFKSRVHRIDRGGTFYIVMITRTIIARDGGGSGFADGL